MFIYQIKFCVAVGETTNRKQLIETTTNKNDHTTTDEIVLMT